MCYLASVMSLVVLDVEREVERDIILMVWGEKRYVRCENEKDCVDVSECDGNEREIEIFLWF